MTNPIGLESEGVNVEKVRRYLSSLFRAIFTPDEEQNFRWLPFVWIGLLILAGAILWGIFFNWGNVPIDYLDWAEVWAARLQAWRDALIHNTLPFHLSDVAAMRGENDRYFAVADMVSSPQVIFLRWLDVGAYSLVNNLLLYGIATYFLLSIWKKYRLSLFSFTVLFFLFHYNGFIVTHLSVGHLSWGGYYLFPAFVSLLLELSESDHAWHWVAKMAIVLFFMFMQGSFHHLVWCFIVLGILAIIRWRQFFLIFKAILFSILLSMPRILPVFQEKYKVPPQEVDFLGGYPRLINIFRALVYNSTPDMAMPRMVFDSSLGYWEFDLFIGVAGFAFLIFFGILYQLVWHSKKRQIPYLLIPAIVLGFLSIGENFLKALFSNPVLVSSERVSSRMMGLVLVIMIILSVIYYQKFYTGVKQNFVIQLSQLALCAVLIGELIHHTLRWSVKSAYVAFGFTKRDLSLIHISNHADPEYYWMLGIGLAISLFSIAFLIWMYLQAPKKHMAPL